MYQILKESESITIATDRPVYVADTINDRVYDRWIFAVKSDDGDRLYHIDYLFFSRDFELLQVLKEHQGVNPDFLTAPDGTVWVELNPTHIARNGRTVLPMENRARITEEIIGRDIGMNTRFDLHDRHFGYHIDYFDAKKSDRLFLYQFDRNGLFKSKKSCIPDGIRNGHPVVLNGRCYAAYGTWNGRICTPHLAEIGKNGTVTPVWDGEPHENLCDVFLLAAPDAEIRLLTYCDNHADLLIYGTDGRLLSEKTVFQAQHRINCIFHQQMRDELAAVQCAIAFDEKPPGQNILLLYENDTFRVYEPEDGRIPSLLGSSHILLNNFGSKDNTNCDFKIVPI